MIELPNKRYGVILADPPWSFKVWSGKGTARSAENHYNTMSQKDICALPVRGLADADCALFMWAVMPQLPEALEAIKAWGFNYKTCAFNWVKQNRKAPPLSTDKRDIFMGMGYWTRANSEICLLATKGKPKRRSASVRQVIIEPVREHSRKPDETFARIEQLLDGPYLELFSRESRAGWDAWGNEVGKFTEVSHAD